jgi:hypothetical protein
VEAIVANSQRELEATSIWKRISRGPEIAKAARAKAFGLLTPAQRTAWNDFVAAPPE